MEGANKLAKKTNTTITSFRMDLRTERLEIWKENVQLANQKTNTSRPCIYLARRSAYSAYQASELPRPLTRNTSENVSYSSLGGRTVRRKKNDKKIPHEQNRYLVGMLYSSLSEPSEWMLGTEGEENGREAHNLQKRKKQHIKGPARLPPVAYIPCAPLHVFCIRRPSSYPQISVDVTPT